MENIKLICIPYAGGSMQAYRSWSKYLDGRIELCPIELAGRGRRFSEPKYESMKEAVNDIYQLIQPLIYGSNYVLFGHSMGSIIVYELLHQLLQKNDSLPKHVIFSGRYPPFLNKNLPDLHDAPLSVFIEEIREMGGTPEELLNNKDFIEIFIPIIRADYSIIEKHRCIQNNKRFSCDISIFNGRYDKDVTAEDLELWKTCTSGVTNIYEFEGGHFFINEKAEDVVCIINSILTALI